jgi:pyruvate formate lyase activating enzyme
MNGWIFDIKRFAIYDGPGIRTTVFMMGCQLNCWWCHNPECLAGNEKTVEKKVMLDGLNYITKNSVAREVTATQVLEEVVKDSVFFEESGGGVTFSGGEPFSQPDFLLSMLSMSKQQSLHTCIDTSGHVSTSWLRKAILMTDLFLYDLKLINKKEHIKYTGISNDLILENLEILAGKPEKIIVRFPVIPGITDTAENLGSVAHLMNKLNLDRIVLLPYHETGKHKYSSLDRDYRMEGVTEPSGVEMEEARSVFREKGIHSLSPGTMSKKKWDIVP